MPIEIRKLPLESWLELKNLRLLALKTDPEAFGSSYEEEEKFPEEEWRKRMASILFALSDGRPVGMISYIFNTRLKTKHIANIYAFYVKPSFRGKGVGKKLLQNALSSINQNGEIVKISLEVNPKLLSAVKLYEHAGFTRCGELRKELKVGDIFIDMIVMEKIIR